MTCLAALLGLGAILALAAEPAKGPLDNLVNNSPFGSSASPGGPGAGPSQLEFRGMFTDKGEQFFSFFDPATRTSQWVGLKETGTPYTVQGYDNATQTVKVLFRNQAFVLTLKRAQIVVQALPPPASVNGGMPGATPPGPAVAAAPSGDEAARLAQVAEEIRRRRALRAQGQPQPPPPQPQPQPAANQPGPLPSPNRP